MSVDSEPTGAPAEARAVSGQAGVRTPVLYEEGHEQSIGVWGESSLIRRLEE